MKKRVIVSLSLLISQISFAQNVGIGTNSPVEKLHVAGNIRTDTVKPNALKITTGAGSGKVLTSDGSGNASWQATSNNSAAGNGNLGYGVWGDCQTNSIITQYQPVEETPFDANADFGMNGSGFLFSVRSNKAFFGKVY